MATLTEIQYWIIAFLATLCFFLFYTQSTYVDVERGVQIQLTEEMANIPAKK